MTDVTVRETDDSHYLCKDHHLVGSRGVYCPDAEGFYDPPMGLESGDDCPVCGEVLGI